LPDFGHCDVCGAPANTLTYDSTVSIRFDDVFEYPAKLESRVEKHFCEEHRRPGNLSFLRESKEAYLARLLAADPPPNEAKLDRRNRNI
jgi:hypothetical protein